MKKDSFNQIIWLFLFTLLFLVVFSFLPTIEWGPLKTKKIDLISDIRVKDIPAYVPEKEVRYADEVLPEDTTRIQEDTRVAIQSGGTTVIRRNPPRLSNGTVVFEDFSPSGDGLSRFLDALRTCKSSDRPVRIAFLGDSYIEADIFTQNIREELQARFGGGGVGYVNMYSEFPGFRRSIVQSGKGWITHNVVNPKAMEWDKMTLLHQYYIPEEGAVATYKGTNRLKGADKWNVSRFLFINRNRSTVRMRLSDGVWMSYSPSSSGEIQELVLEGETSSFQVRVDSVSGFTALGVWLDGQTGVSVDNISIRGYSGTSLGRMNMGKSFEMNGFIPYDLIVLEYGLNVMTAEITDYRKYAGQMKQAVSHLKECYPDANVMILGVGDRSYRKDGEFITMPAVPALVEAQREVARSLGVVFWDTYQAMGGYNSMLSFVEHKPPLANKDYTHINHAGGKQLAGYFVRSLELALEPSENITGHED